MDSEEKNLITQFFARVGGGQGVTRALPPIDQEANQLISQEFRRYPDAAYRVTQLAVVQEAALARANQRIQQLQAQLQQAQTQKGGLFSNLFGGGRTQVPPRPSMGSVPPVGAQYPTYYPRAGSGFLGSALTTAAGVAGGIMAADALESMFMGHHGVPSDMAGTDFGSSVDATDPFSGSGAEVQGYDDSDFGGSFDGGFDDGGFGGDDFGDDFSGDSMF